MGRQLLPMMADVTALLHECRRAHANIMFEGAQGSLLDIDHGTLSLLSPAPTPPLAALPPGSGFGPLYLDYVLGITKAYTTGLAPGRFPRNCSTRPVSISPSRGHEFGATTGRARRCGWFDAVALRNAVNINSVSGICLTKLDVLDGLETIRICVGYTCKDGKTGAQPGRFRGLRKAGAGL